MMHRAQAGERPGPIGSSYVAAFLAFLFLPITNVFMNAFNGDPALQSWGGFTAEWFTQVLREPEVWVAVRASALIGLTSTLISLSVGATAAIGLWQAGRVGRSIGAATVATRILLPEIVLATAMTLAFSAAGIELGFITIVLGHTVVNSAYVTVIVLARLSGRSAPLEEAAADLGAGPLGILFRVTLPFLRPAMVASGLLAFAFSFDNIVLSFFLSGGRVTTLPILLFSKMRFQVTPDLNAIAALMALSSTTFLVFFAVLARKLRSGLAAMSAQRGMSA